MKSLALGLQTSIVTSYDQTKTTLQGRTGLRTITDGNGAKSCLGIQPIIAMDVFDDTGVSPGSIQASTPNNRIFIQKSNALGVLIISYYLLTTTNGVTTAAWVGDLKLDFGASANTYTMKGFMVDDSNPAAMVFQWVATHTTATDGGYFACWGVNVTDFHQVAVTTFPVATLANQTKAVYQIGDNASQASQTVTVAAGVGIDTTGKNAYVLNGASATPKIFKFTYTNPPNTVPGANGYTNTNFTLVTGTLTASSGTTLLVNNVQVITPNHTANSGSLCLSWLTTTNIYVAKVSDIVNAAVTLPSLVTSDTLVGPDYVAPGNIQMGQYIAAADRWVLSNAGGVFVYKQCINGDTAGGFFGAISEIKTETGGTLTPVDFGGSTAAGYVCITDCNGFVILTNSNTGQRNALALDLASDYKFPLPSTGQIQAGIISPVISGAFTKGIYLAIYKQLSKRSVYPTIQYRTSGFATGPGAGFDALWTTTPIDGDLSLLTNATQVQFRILFRVTNIDLSNTSQINEAYLLYTDVTQISENWEGSVDNSTPSGTSPMYVAFRMRTAYGSVVPKLFVRGVDDSGNVIFLFDTVTNIGVFSYTTNNGTSWTALGTIPNTALTTEVRVNVASPSGTRLTWSISEQ